MIASTDNQKPKQKPRALIADDDIVSRAALSGAISGMGIDVVAEVADGIAARDKLTSVNPDLVCLDIDMPGMNGLDVLAHLRDNNTQMVAIVVTASPTAQNVREALSGQADGLLVKPFTRDRAENAIRAAIKARREKIRNSNQ